MSGLPGFDGREPDLAIGSVTGVRWWNLRMPDGPDGLPELSLAGMYASLADLWEPGENTARCARWARWCSEGQEHQVPDEECGCGFWAYWDAPDAPNPHGFSVPILGVIEGWGRTLIGDRGFRCARARIAALHFASDAAALVKYEHRPDYGPDYARFRTDDAVKTWRKLCGREEHARLGPDETAARLAALELLLEERYGVPVYGTRGLMLARHPPTIDYLPPEKRPAPPAGPPLAAAEAMARLQAKAEPPS